MPLPRTSPPIPDLLSAVPAVRVDALALRQILVFAFATGGARESFDDVLATAALPATRWDRDDFAKDLFLDRLVAQGLAVHVGGRPQKVCAPYMLRVLTEPPADIDVVHFRRAILAELAASPATRAELEGIYGSLVGLRALFCAGARVAERLRRLDLLRAVHAIFRELAASFEGATSGLARVRAFGAAVCDGEGFRSLDAVLDHEEHLGTVDLSVRVGVDGELRAFQIVRVRENDTNPFYTSPLGRWVAKIRLLWRGYRMNGGEVTERLFDDIFTGLEESLVLLFQLLGDIEVYLGSLGLRDRAEAAGLSVCLPELVGAGDPGGMSVEGLFNPLLLGAKYAPVPCDLRTHHAGSVVVVTGPNSGGKTRLLQAIATAQLLGEAGLFVPARAARLPRVPGLFVSIVEEARADQTEGQLGMELLRIRRMFERLDAGALVLLDELCSGTNPSEGEEIARLVLTLLPELGARVFVTTHLLQFAASLEAERPRGSLEFMQVELDGHDRPTYRFVPGVARTSLAHKTAARLGVTRDELLALIAEKRRAAGLGEREASDPGSGPVTLHASSADAAAMAALT